ncbi:peptide deformylase [bacterium E08(2017)]|nr:peptide deformylase [bacterium E08(2017)]
MQYHVRIYGDPILREKSVPVAEIDEEIVQLAEDMVVTMRDNNGAGLAAQQIGRTERICIIDITDEVTEDDDVDEHLEMPLVLINPEIVEREGEQIGQEGCLSFPEVFINVARSEKVTVVFKNLEGEDQRITVRGLVARAVQHELDHLDGVLLVDHMTPVQKVSVAGKLKRMKKKALRQD